MKGKHRLNSVQKELAIYSVSLIISDSSLCYTLFCVCVHSETSWQIHEIFACWHFGSKTENEKNSVENVSNAKLVAFYKSGLSIIRKKS